MQSHPPKRVVILGSTGSIGTQVLDVIRAEPKLFRVVGLSTNQNTALLEQQAAEFHPEKTVIASRDPQALDELAAWESADLVVNAIVGFAGLRPALAALRAGKQLALANKESLVAGGELVMREARTHGATHTAPIIPIDSEHAAIFQCMRGGQDASQNSDGHATDAFATLSKVTLTCSGGPFRGKKKSDLASITAREALQHPTWSMGQKISIDSATLMNKGFEIIEAKWLFDLRPDQIDVVIHPESVVHSFVEFIDGNVLAQLAVPDMRVPIHYALHYPERVANPVLDMQHLRLDLIKQRQLTFDAPDLETFPCLTLARHALEIGGTMPTVLNAANEVAVERFLAGHLGFNDIPELVERAIQKHHSIPHPTLDDIIAADQETRGGLEKTAF